MSPSLPFSVSRTVLALAAIGAGWVSITLARAAEHGPADALRFAPDARTQATAWVDPQRMVQLRIAPGAIAQALPAPEGDDEREVALDSLDVDFDGHADLVATAPAGMVNQAAAIYLYDPATRRFYPLPAPVADGVSCEGFWDPVPDPATRTVTSSCRSGPVWYTDVYRFDAQRRLYVYRTQRMISGELGGLIAAPDEAPLAVWTTWSPGRRVLERVVANGLGAPPTGPLVALTGTVTIARLALHARPDAGPSRRYLIQGDRFEALDVSDDGEWLLVRYRTPQRGAIGGWVRIPAAAP